MSRRKQCYIAYNQADEFLALGTVDEVASALGTTVNAVKSKISHWKRGDIKNPESKSIKLRKTNHVKNKA